MGVNGKDNYMSNPLSSICCTVLLILFILSIIHK